MTYTYIYGKQENHPKDLHNNPDAAVAFRSVITCIQLYVDISLHIQSLEDFFNCQLNIGAQRC